MWTALYNVENSKQNYKVRVIIFNMLQMNLMFDTR